MNNNVFTMLQVFLDKWQLVFSINWIILIILIPALGLVPWIKNKSNLMFSREVEIDVFGNKLRLKRSYEVSQIAHQAWTELVTRKAGIPIDFEHDVIAEVYNSWYQLFTETRSLIKAIPAEYKTHPF